MNYFLKNNFVLFGDSCSGKTFIYKKINFLKIDIDYFLMYKNVFFKNEYFYRYFEKKFFNNFIIKKYIIILGGGFIQFINKTLFKKNIFIFKNINFINFIKRLNYENNRPLLKKKKYIKIRFFIRKKKYSKITNIFFNKCLVCNFKKIYENNKI
ncbi:shikimate kinase [Candidatus Carsonella ruddii]|uniref:Putative shikimate kinase I n=1 Tax=Candidatus Carsonella ruddii PC isolate NHV TaxID=1202540 RepID=J3Z1W5_CARRU|nr:shikimate kinase [Candidatus Carsonella ruddii]AFP84254.1 putative shikimate kinase I [Candidatus Carsonella ruddii PC isolate NHV]